VRVSLLIIVCLIAGCYSQQPVLAAALMDHDPFQGAVQVCHFSFENEDDRDFDELPDDWSRRKGKNFPAYVETRIDRESGQQGDQSLFFDVKGGQAVMYSQPIRIDAFHSYVFRGMIRTEQLNHTAALLSVSLLNHKRIRVQRYLSKPVMGTHRDWVELKLGPIAPNKDVHFVVIGCHVAGQKHTDINGKVWFDNLYVGKLPQLDLVSNYDIHFKKRDADIEITSQVSGLDPGQNAKPHQYQLDMKMINSSDEIDAKTSYQLSANNLAASDENDLEENESGMQSIKWALKPKDYGFYRVQSVLKRDGQVILEKNTSFAVMDLVTEAPRGEFGWSISKPIKDMPIMELADIAAQAGINWVKYPLWKSVYSKDKELPIQIGGLFEKLTRRNITPIGLLNDPPDELRRKFATNWMGISEIFTMPPEFWSPSLEPVIARYSSSVRHWQLGSETDVSFIGLNRIGKSMTDIKQTLDRIGRDTQVGLHWDWNTPIPQSVQRTHFFLSIKNSDRLSSEDLVKKLMQSENAAVQRWVLLRPLSRSQHSLEERGADLVKRMVAAKIGGADAIFAADVFDPEYGLLNQNGSPTLLFLPWRSTALALQGSEFIGSINMPGGSKNYAFARSNEVVLIVWNEEATTEEIFLGDQVSTMNVWGQQRSAKADPATKRQSIQVGPIPVIIRGCSEPIARWRLAVRLEKGRLRSETGEHEEAILGTNTFPQGVSGEITLNTPHDWKVNPGTWTLHAGRKEPFRLPTLITLPTDASLGLDELSIDFKISADRPYEFRVYRPYQVGLGDVLLEVSDRKLADGRLEIEQIISNRTSPPEVLNFRCNLAIPNRKRQKQTVIKLGNGEDHKFYYLADADALHGKKLRLRAEQINGRRVLNFRWTVGQNWLPSNKSDTIQRENISQR